MSKILLLKTSKNGKEYKMYATENSEVVMSVEQDGRKLCQDVELVDLFGQKTHVPTSVLIATHVPTPSQEQSAKVASFKRICLKRFSWSTGCLHF
ncbi:MAG: hypothetical protein VZR95_01115 [Alphaproteobacteria bacterium]